MKRKWLTQSERADKAESERSALARDAIKVVSALVEERDRYKAVVEWIASKTNLLFAECSDAEEIVKRCADALNPNNLKGEGK